MPLLVRARSYLDHIRSRGQEKAAKGALPGYRARRWVWSAHILGSIALVVCSFDGKRKPATTWHFSSLLRFSDKVLLLFIQGLAALQLQSILRREEHVAAQALRDHVASCRNQGETAIRMICSQHGVLMQRGIHHLERVERGILAQQRLPQRRFQLSEWIALFLIVMHDGGGFLHLLEFCTIQQALQQRGLVMELGGNGGLAALGWQGGAWNVQEMGQINEHRAMGDGFH